MEVKSLGVIRQYYYEKYESFQYQLMIIAGGTLTVFVSLNTDNQLLSLYKWGFLLLGCSLIAGTLSVVTSLIHIILIAEYDLVKNELEKDQSKNNEIAIKIYQHYTKNGYLDYLNIIFGMLQCILFLTGIIFIIIGLVQAPI